MLGVGRRSERGEHAEEPAVVSMHDPARRQSKFADFINLSCRVRSKRTASGRAPGLFEDKLPKTGDYDIVAIFQDHPNVADLM